MSSSNSFYSLPKFFIKKTFYKKPSQYNQEDIEQGEDSEDFD